MFLDFYALKEQPFGVTPDPRFLYLSPAHREALASPTLLALLAQKMGSPAYPAVPSRI